MNEILYMVTAGAARRILFRIILHKSTKQSSKGGTVENGQGARRSL